MERKTIFFIFSFTAMAVLLACPVLAQEASPPPPLEVSEIDILMKYLLLAFIFEAVYAAIFQWTVFIRYLNDTGAKTVVKVGLAWATIANYPEMNIIREIGTSLFKSPEKSAGMGQFITALLIAGGSSAIYDIMSKYLRDTKALNKKIAEIEAKKAAEQAAGEGDEG
jgi:hypothetical protein